MAKNKNKKLSWKKKKNYRVKLPTKFTAGDQREISKIIGEKCGKR